MTANEAEAVFNEIVEAIACNDELLRLHRELCLLAVRYARMRTDWRLADRETGTGMEAARSSAHNAFIDACNIMGRACAKHGHPNEWWRRLGEDRKKVGDFACHIHAQLGILAR
jgi:hypothetical protein